MFYGERWDTELTEFGIPRRDPVALAGMGKICSFLVGMLWIGSGMGLSAQEPAPREWSTAWDEFVRLSYAPVELVSTPVQRKGIPDVSVPADALRTLAWDPRHEAHLYTYRYALRSESVRSYPIVQTVRGRKTYTFHQEVESVYEKFRCSRGKGEESLGEIRISLFATMSGEREPGQATRWRLSYSVQSNRPWSEVNFLGAPPLDSWAVSSRTYGRSVPAPEGEGANNPWLRWVAPEGDSENKGVFLRRQSGSSFGAKNVLRSGEIVPSERHFWQLSLDGFVGVGDMFDPGTGGGPDQTWSMTANLPLFDDDLADSGSVTGDEEAQEEGRQESGRDSEVLLVVPLEDADRVGLEDSARRARREIFSGDARIAYITIPGLFGTEPSERPYGFYERDGSPFSYPDAGRYRWVIFLTHTGYDGPTLSYGKEIPWQISQPFHRRRIRHPEWAMSSDLVEAGEDFWRFLGRLMAADGVLILPSCYSGQGGPRGDWKWPVTPYAREVACYSGRVVYGATERNGSGDWRILEPQLRRILKGKTPQGYERFDPE